VWPGNSGDVALAAKTDPTTLADRPFAALITNDYGQVDRLIEVLAPALGQTGLERLKQRMIDLANQPVVKPGEKDRAKIGWSSRGPIYADEMAERSRISMVRRALEDIADAMAISTPPSSNTTKEPERSRRSPRKLRGACFPPGGRKKHGRRSRRPSIRDAAAAGIGRTSNGKTRASTFSRPWAEPTMPRRRAGDARTLVVSTPSPGLLKRVPEFDDVEAEKRALNHAQCSRYLLHALSFLVR
jgi:hypothetical protein